MSTVSSPFRDSEFRLNSPTNSFELNSQLTLNVETFCETSLCADEMQQTSEHYDINIENVNIQTESSQPHCMFGVQFQSQECLLMEKEEFMMRTYHSISTQKGRIEELEKTLRFTLDEFEQMRLLNQSLQSQLLESNTKVQVEATNYLTFKKLKSIEIKELTERIELLDSLLMNTEEENKSMKSLLASTTSQNESSLKNYKELEHELDSFRSKDDHNAAIVAQLKSRVNELTNELEAANVVEADLKSENAYLKWQEKKHEEHVQSLQYELTCMQSKIQEMKNKESEVVKQLESTVGELKVQQYHSQLEISSLRLQLVHRCNA
eukprot:CAMPEP_0170115798 /NCGR_PEP_ID=MMETSP0020_2-20130122/11768_1 /TAXON_ID=98059 /ORGANISM="Dinobryon sp., Strain UTEXLB2267" /LENGTH=321 /DNA_ID=CAMNT_0010343553 /DNA_START=159 /DNA_END=1121 /DNA_ORIENTATION=+